MSGGSYYDYALAMNHLTHRKGTADVELSMLPHDIRGRARDELPTESKKQQAIRAADTSSGRLDLSKMWQGELAVFNLLSVRPEQHSE